MEKAMIDEIVNDLFENDDAFVSENCDVLLPQYESRMRGRSSCSTISNIDPDLTVLDSSSSDESSPYKQQQQQKQYHTIYMKPIINRLMKLTNSSHYTEE